MPKPRTQTAAGLSDARGYYSSITLTDQDKVCWSAYPYSVPAVKFVDGLMLDPKVTIFVGENGTGKSTLIEAIAVAAGFNPEGGSKNFNFTTRPSHSSLHNNIKLERGARRERDGYFLRAECMYNVATELDKLDANGGAGKPLIQSYGDVSLHEQSHGESFFALVSNRFGEDSFYVMDEPESALSPDRQLYLLSQMHELIENGNCQVVFATHSPILMAYPGARLYLIDRAGIHETTYKETEHYRIMHDFLTDHKSAIRSLFAAPTGSSVTRKRSAS